MTMKKRVLILLMTIMFILTLIGCSNKNEKSNFSNTVDPMFIIVCYEDDEWDTDWYIVYHKETKVMYAVSCGAYNRGVFTLLVNADGTPMIWEGE